ncbi:MAG TPA: LPS assembly lipoprotein LptE [Saprospiraceae bacterium]|nr:LPS assembly lipoprotein LptE [Saprospiraceae bacterium]HMP26005.1 LPS assembly lipoprotein LptE [Saprospiraceae bacterium]
MICNKITSLTAVIVVLLVSNCLSGCYSLSGVSISPDVRTYYVEQFRNNAENAPPALEQRLTEDFKEKIRTESRLIFSDTDPDLEFKGSIVDFRVTSEAPQPGELTAINRLTINMAIEYINNKEKDKGWKSNFSFFFDFPSTQDLISVQDEAIRVISNQLMEDIFNKAFTDW